MLLDHRGRPLTITKPRAVPIRARYDAAQTTDESRRHWQYADSLSSVSANSSCVRRKLRERSRYEVSNNSYARGILDTLADYAVGSGPTLQLTYRGPARDDLDSLRVASQRVEYLFATWAYARKLGEKLHASHLALDQDGEAFGILTTASRSSLQTPVQLDVRLYECDHFDLVAGGSWMEDDAGVRIGSDGEPTEYAFSETHPGDMSGAVAASSWISADQVVHLFRKDRPGQLRGVPKTVPALPLFAYLRRFTLATITAAEVAADFAAVLTPAVDDEADSFAPWDRLDIERGAMLTTPAGSVLSQLKAEHPNATFDEFVKAILREIARCLGVPAVLALGDASKYNYSSGRLDLQAFNRQVEVERRLIIERLFLDRLFEEWMNEALMISDFIPMEFADAFQFFEWGWRWQSAGHVDRQKEAAGQAAELSSHTTTLAREYAKQGLDWRTELEQRAQELALMKELGLQQSQPTMEQSEGDQDESDNAGSDS